MHFVVSLLVTMGCMLRRLRRARRAHLVLWQPWEFVIIMGSALGTFIVANPVKVIQDAGKAITPHVEGRKHQRLPRSAGIAAFADARIAEQVAERSRGPRQLHLQIPIFNKFPNVLKNKEVTAFICDYCRFFILGNILRAFEVESLIDEEIAAIKYDKLKPYHALTAIGDGLPALGIVAAVLGVIHAMGALNSSPSSWRVDRRGDGRRLTAGIFVSYRSWRAAGLQGQGRAHEGMLCLSHPQAGAAHLHEPAPCRKSPLNMAASRYPPMNAPPSTRSRAKR